MKKKELVINDRFITTIPLSWNDIEPGKIKSLCKLLIHTNSIDHLKVHFFLVITGLRIVKKDPVFVSTIYGGEHYFLLHSRKTGRIWVNSDDIDAVCKHFNFLFSVHNNKSYVDSYLFVNHFPDLRNKRFVNLYGPDSALYNITLGEFIRLETLYEHINHDPKLLFQFFACLYRPKDHSVNKLSPDFKGDIRQPFNDHLVDHNSRYTKCLFDWQKMYIRLFYDGCRKFIISKHPMAFSSDGNSSEGTTFENFSKLVNVLSGGNPANSEAIRQTLLWDILPELERTATEANNMKQNKTKP